MTTTWRRLETSEPDHELIWTSVTIVSALLSAVWLTRLGLPQVVCPFHALTGLPCLTCGATRALAALLRGDLATSLRTNPLVGAGAAAAALYVPYALTAACFRLPRLRVRLDRREQTGVRWLIGVVAIALWIYLIVDGR